MTLNAESIATTMPAAPAAPAAAPRRRPFAAFFEGELGAFVAIMGIVNLGLLVRVLLVVSGNGFPLNDGGMFYAMVQDLQRAHYHIPAFTTYNDSNIPFAYPPLGFYMAGALNDVFGMSLIDVLRFVPMAFSTATIVAFYLLARRMIQTRSIAVIATLLFALTPRAFNWEIVGGGLTRSPGLFFAVLALWQGYRMYTERSRAAVALTTLFAGLAALFHMEMAWFVAYSMVFFFLVKGRSRQGAIDSIAVGAGVLALTAPWWLTVVSRHGLDPFLAALQTGGHSHFAGLALLLFRFTDEPLFPLVAALGLLGIVYSLGKGQYQLVVWFALILLLDPRKAPTLATLPLSILGAVAVTQVLAPAAQGLLSSDGEGRSLRAVRISLTVAVLGYGVFSALLTPVDAKGSPLNVMPAAERTAMEWVRDNTPAASSFLVLTSSPSWSTDSGAEWFPVLAGRRSVATVQGTEWKRHTAWVEQYDDIQSCAWADADCVEGWLDSAGLSADFVFVSKAPVRVPGLLLKTLEGTECCNSIRASLAGSGNYTVVYDSSGATIFRRQNSGDEP